MGLYKSLVDLLEKGFSVYTSETEHEPFDIIAYKTGGIFKRIQVKYRAITKNGTINLSFRASWADKNGSHVNFYDKNEIDLFCIYCPDTDKCYYIDPNNFNKNVKLRFQQPKKYGNRKEGIHLAEDFLKLPL